MKLKSVLIASALLFSTPLFAEVGGGNAGNGTPTQVAGGTVNSANGIYTVTVSPKGTTIAALDGEVSFTRADGTSVKIDIGSGRVIGADGNETTQTLAEIVAAEKAAGNTTGGSSVTASLTAALKVVADNTAAGKYGDGATTLLASLVKVMSVANPEAAAEYVGTAVSAITSPSSGATDKSEAAFAIAQATSSDGTSASDAVLVALLTAASANNVSVKGYDGSELAKQLNDLLSQPGTSVMMSYTTTPITPIDPTVITVSPSGGNQ